MSKSLSTHATISFDTDHYPYSEIGDSLRAIEYYEQQLALIRVFGDQRGEANAISSIALAYDRLGDVERAKDYYEKALPWLTSLNDSAREAICSWNYGNLLVRQGDFKRGTKLMKRCVDYEQKVGHTKYREHLALLKLTQALK